MIEKFLTEKQQAEVIQRLQALEAKIDIEVIPMLVSKSSHIGHVRIILFLIFLLLVVLLDLSSLFWLTPKVELILFILGVCIAYGLSIYFASYSFLQRLLTSNKDEEAQVRMRAENEFFRGAFERTERRNSVLIFCSMMEQRSFVYSDIEIRKAISDEYRAQIKGAVATQLKNRRPDLAFIQAMDLIEASLKDKLPAPQGKINEISDQIIIKD